MTNRFVCAGRVLRKSLSPQQNFVATTSRTKSNQIELVQLVTATQFCCADKDFHKNSPVDTKRFVAATYRPTCTHGVVCHREVCSDMSLSVYRPYRFIHYLSWFSKTRNVCFVYSGTKSSSRAWNLKPVTSTTKSQ